MEERRTKLHRLVAMGLRIRVMVVGMRAAAVTVVVESNKLVGEVNGKLGWVAVVVGGKEMVGEGIGWVAVVMVMVEVGVHDTLYMAAVVVGVALYMAVVVGVNWVEVGNRQVEEGNRQVEVGEIGKDRLEVVVNAVEEVGSGAVAEESTLVVVVESWAVAVNCNSKQVGVERIMEEEVGNLVEVGESLVEAGVVVVGYNTPALVVEEREVVGVESKLAVGVRAAVEMVGVVMVEVGVESKLVGAAVGVTAVEGKVVEVKAAEEMGEVGVESRLAVVGAVEKAEEGKVVVVEESRQAAVEKAEVGKVEAGEESVVGKWGVNPNQVAAEMKQQQVAEKAPPQVATEQHKKDIQKNCNPQA